MKTKDIPAIVMLSAGGVYCLLGILYQIPFLTSGSLCDRENNQRLTSQSELIEEAISRIKNFHQNSEYKNFAMGLNSHLFTLGSTPSDSERHFIGNTELINKEVFSDFTYVALGHLHKKQKVTDNCFYAGSPLAYAFDEANAKKSFLDITIDTSKKTDQIITKEIPIKPEHKVVKLSGKFDDFYKFSNDESSEYFEYKNDYIEITCTDNILIENPVARLKENFPNILSIKQEAILKKQSEKSNSEKNVLLNQKENMDSKKIFIEFVKDVDNFENEKDWESTIKLFCEIEKTVQKD